MDAASGGGHDGAACFLKGACRLFASLGKNADPAGSWVARPARRRRIATSFGNPPRGRHPLAASRARASIFTWYTICGRALRRAAPAEPPPPRCFVLRLAGTSYAGRGNGVHRSRRSWPHTAKDAKGAPSRSRLGRAPMALTRVVSRPPCFSQCGLPGRLAARTFPRSAPALCHSRA